jgi:hypothetical protein
MPRHQIQTKQPLLPFPCPAWMQVADGYRPPLPAGLPAGLAVAINACWKGDTDLRPTARQVVQMLQAIRDSGGWGRHHAVRGRVLSQAAA